MSETSRIAEAFKANTEGVAKLVHFDREILSVAVSQIADLHLRLVNGGYSNPALNAQNTLTMLRAVRDNDSLKGRYSIIYNQAVVLLVSFFGSAIEDLFKYGVATRLGRDEDSALTREEIRVSFREMREREWNLKEAAPDLLVEKKDLSFQDMQAIRRAFHDYLSVDLEKDKIVNDIILAQACRHVIVHAGGVANTKLRRQVAGAVPRDLKIDVLDGVPVQFTPEEVATVSSSMHTYVARVATRLDASLNNGG